MTTIVSDAAPNAGQIMGYFLNKYAPGSRSWVSDRLYDVALGDTPSRRFGGVKVSLSGLLASDGMLLIATLSK